MLTSGGQIYKNVHSETEEIVKTEICIQYGSILYAIGKDTQRAVFSLSW